MSAFFPLPAPFFQPVSYRFDDNSGFSSPQTATLNPSTMKWVIGLASNVDDGQLAAIATVIEKEIQQDFAGSLEDDTSRTVGALNGSPAWVITVDQAADAPTILHLGANSFTVGEAASLAALIRSIPGHGTQWTPPA